MRPPRSFELRDALAVCGVENQNDMTVLHGDIQGGPVGRDAKAIWMFEAEGVNRVDGPKNFAGPQIIGCNCVLVLLGDEKTAGSGVRADTADHFATHWK